MARKHGPMTAKQAEWQRLLKKHIDIHITGKHFSKKSALRNAMKKAAKAAKAERNRGK
jgi:hypothetical protein